MSTHVMAIDQGTTSSRTMIFDQRLSVVAMAQEEFAQHYPRSGWAGAANLRIRSRFASPMSGKAGGFRVAKKAFWGLAASSREGIQGR